MDVFCQLRIEHCHAPGQVVLGQEIVHAGLSLGELHFVHAFAGAPMEERLSVEHGGELIANALEHLLDGGGVIF